MSYLNGSEDLDMSPRLSTYPSRVARLCYVVGFFTRRNVQFASQEGKYPRKPSRFPLFQCWDNPTRKTWAFGWRTGIDVDLFCVFPNIKTRVMEHWTLSPTSHSKLLSFVGFITKRLLFAIDSNLWGLD